MMNSCEKQGKDDDYFTRWNECMNAGLAQSVQYIKGVVGMSRRQSLEAPDELPNAKKLLYSVRSSLQQEEYNCLLCAKPAIMDALCTHVH